jgi:hypothetical protein
MDSILAHSPDLPLGLERFREIGCDGEHSDRRHARSVTAGTAFVSRRSQRHRGRPNRRDSRSPGELRLGLLAQRFDRQDPWVVLWTRLFSPFDLQSRFEQSIEQCGQRDVPHANTPGNPVTKPGPYVRPLRPPISRKQLWGRDSPVTRERPDKAGVGTDAHDAAAAPHNSSGLRRSATPIIDIGLDERSERRVERAVSERQAGNIAAYQTFDLSTAPGNSELIRREIQADNGLACGSQRREVYAPSAAEFEAPTWTWAKPCGKQRSSALHERGQPLVVPACIGVVAGAGLHVPHGRNDCKTLTETHPRRLLWPACANSRVSSCGRRNRRDSRSSWRRQTSYGGALGAFGGSHLSPACHVSRLRAPQAGLTRSSEQTAAHSIRRGSVA